MPPTIRTTFDTSGNLTAIETFQGPRGWVHILSEPIQRGDVPDLAAAIRERSIIDGSSPTPDEARSIGRVAEHLRGLAAEVEPSRMADGFEADRMRLLAHRLRQVAALMPDSDEARRLVEEAIGANMALACHGDWSDEQRAVDRAHADAARAALLRALGVEA